jgi:hypothetical protein
VLSFPIRSFFDEENLSINGASPVQDPGTAQAQQGVKLVIELRTRNGAQRIKELSGNKSSCPREAKCCPSAMNILARAAASSSMPVLTRWYRSPERLNAPSRDCGYLGE